MSKLDTLEPECREKVEQLLINTEAITGRKWGISDGRRTLKEQGVIWLKGRDKDGNIIDKKKVVTNAKPGSSPHNFGLAADVWPLSKDGKDFYWNAPGDLMKIMADEAVKLGLVAGYYFKTIHDAPHVETKNWREKRALWLAGKLEVA